MNDWLQSYTNLMTALTMIAMAGNIDSMARAIIGPKLEKRLGRPLTEWDWHIFCHEKGKKL